MKRGFPTEKARTMDVFWERRLKYSEWNLNNCKSADTQLVLFSHLLEWVCDRFFFWFNLCCVCFYLTLLTHDTTHTKIPEWRDQLISWIKNKNLQLNIGVARTWKSWACPFPCLVFIAGNATDLHFRVGVFFVLFIILHIDEYVYMKMIHMYWYWFALYKRWILTIWGFPFLIGSCFNGVDYVHQKTTEYCPCSDADMEW